MILFSLKRVSFSLVASVTMLYRYLGRCRAADTRLPRNGFLFALGSGEKER